MHSEHLPDITKALAFGPQNNNQLITNPDNYHWEQRAKQRRLTALENEVMALI